MTEPSSIPRYLTEALDAQPAVAGANHVDCAEEVLQAYMTLMKGVVKERDAFEHAVRIYQARNQNVSSEAARRAVAGIICRKP
ncbi:MAG TPA: hypothetical protein VGP42_06275 [Stellaceae bacterium]|jgi:hypothetical protein|nr:hypothetical protein [Stellaceae bacterium]